MADRVRYLKATDEGVRTMGNVFDEIRAEGVEQGLKEGMKEGAKEGAKQGAEKKLLEDVRNLVAELDLLPERALEVLHVPVEDRPRILSML